VDRYVDILDQAFLIRKLPPYHANIGKRLVKSPKVYFRDTGLLHYFLGIRTRADLDTHPARGPSFEAFVLDQLIAAYARAVPGGTPYFWRTAQGDETDLLMDLGARRVPFEIKLHSSPTPDDAQGLRRCMHLLDLARGYLVYPGRERFSLGHGITALPAESLLADPLALARL
jgi:uncharacterized protein